MLANTELKPKAIATLPFTAVALAEAWEAGLGTVLEALAFAGIACADSEMLLCVAFGLDDGVAVPLKVLSSEIVGTPDSVDCCDATV